MSTSDTTIVNASITTGEQDTPIAGMTVTAKFVRVMTVTVRDKVQGQDKNKKKQDRVHVTGIELELPNCPARIEVPFYELSNNYRQLYTEDLPADPDERKAALAYRANANKKAFAYSLTPGQDITFLVTSLTENSAHAEWKRRAQSAAYQAQASRLEEVVDAGNLSEETVEEQEAVSVDASMDALVEEIDSTAAEVLDAEETASDVAEVVETDTASVTAVAASSSQELPEPPSWYIEGSIAAAEKLLQAEQWLQLRNALLSEGDDTLYGGTTVYTAEVEKVVVPELNEEEQAAFAAKPLLREWGKRKNGEKGEKGGFVKFRLFSNGRMASVQGLLPEDQFKGETAYERRVNLEAFLLEFESNKKERKPTYVDVVPYHCWEEDDNRPNSKHKGKMLRVWGRMLENHEMRREYCRTGNCVEVVLVDSVTGYANGVPKQAILRGYTVGGGQIKVWLPTSLVCDPCGAESQKEEEALRQKRLKEDLNFFRHEPGSIKTLAEVVGVATDNRGGTTLKDDDGNCFLIVSEMARRATLYRSELLKQVEVGKVLTGTFEEMVGDPGQDEALFTLTGKDFNGIAAVILTKDLKPSDKFTPGVGYQLKVVQIGEDQVIVTNVAPTPKAAAAPKALSKKPTIVQKKS